MFPMAVARSSSGRVTKSEGEGAILGVFFPTDNALYSITKPIEMQFGMMSGLGPRNSVLRGGDDPRKERGILEENVLDNNPINNPQ